MSIKVTEELEQLDEVKCHVFSWDLKGYDCVLTKIRSPNFTVNFQVTDWYIELDLSKLQNINSSIPFRLQRISGIGPDAVTLDVKVTVKLDENKDFSLEKSQTAKVFSEQTENYWVFDIVIPFQKLEYKDFDEFIWLSPRNLLIDIEMKSSKKIDPVCPQMYWNSESSLVQVLEDLKTLYDKGCHHDLVLKVGRMEFKLHKCVLNVRWPKLMSILEISESSEGVETKEFFGIVSTIITALLWFAYTGNLDFMNILEEIDPGNDIFALVRKYNFYRLNDRITQLSPKCCSSQFFQSYRTTIEMKFTNVTSTKTAMGDFRTCEIPLKTRLPTSPELKDAKKMEKIQRHIRFLDLKVYVDKGPLGYNWLMFSIVLGKLPQENPVTIKCKLYVVGENEILYLLSEQNLVFDRSTEVSFTTPISEEKRKVCKRYQKISEPVITWRELTDESMNFMRKKEFTLISGETNLEEKDLCFRFELKLTDGEYACDTRHGEFEWNPIKDDYTIFSDLELVYNDEKFTDIKVTSGDISIKTHKAILAARSKVLDAVLREQPNLKSLPIKIQPENLHIFVQYIYTGQLHEVPNNKMVDLLSVAEEYKMECLKDILNQRMVVTD